MKPQLNLSTSKILRFSGIFGTLLVFVTIVVFSFLNPSYSHAMQTISELNARGMANATLMNISYTISFAFLIIFSFHFLKQKSISGFLAGLLMFLAFLLIIVLNWFFPMDPWEGFRTARDQIHNNVITVAVCLFLASQLFAYNYFIEVKDNSSRKITLVLFIISFIFGLMSIYANIYHSELINISERGWMVSFLVYIALISHEAL